MTAPPATHRPPPWLRRALWGLGGLWLVVMVIVFAARMGFAMELEWMEGGMIHQALRLQRGEAIYPPPSAEFIPFLYTPLFPTLLAALGYVFPLGLALGRAVSIMAWVAIGAGLWRAVAREGKSRDQQIIALALWCASYVFTFRWVDLARPDTLMLALVVWALVLLRNAWGDLGKAALAGLLMALAFWTKQTAAIFVIASGLAGLLVAPRQLWVYALVIAAVDGGGMLWGNHATDGWLWRYVYEFHQAHAFNQERFTDKTWGMFVHAAPWLTLLSLLVLVDFARPWLGKRRRLDPTAQSRRYAWLSAHRGFLFWGVMASAGGLASALGYSTQWAEPNAFLPGACLGALWLAVGMPTHGRRGNAALALVLAQLTFSLLWEPYYQPIQTGGWRQLGKSYRWQDPWRTIPTSAQRDHARQLHDRLATSRHEVLALARPYWSIIAGGRGHAGSMGLSDIGDLRRPIERELAQRVRDTLYDEIWFEGEPPTWLRSAVAGRYHVATRSRGQDRVRPLSGWMSEAGVVTPYTADQIQFVPIRPSSVPAGARSLADFEDGTLQGFTTTGGFGRRPVTGFTGNLPQPAGVGGSFWLSSASVTGQLELEGEATSIPFDLGAGVTLTLKVAVIGDGTGLAIDIIDDKDDPIGQLAMPGSQAVMTEIAWTPTTRLQVRIRVSDHSRIGAVAIDDLWLLPNAVGLAPQPSTP